MSVKDKLLTRQEIAAIELRADLDNLVLRQRKESGKNLHARLYRAFKDRDLLLDHLAALRATDRESE
jgi:hypothetical protein